MDFFRGILVLRRNDAITGEKKLVCTKRKERNGIVYFKDLLRKMILFHAGYYFLKRSSKNDSLE